MKHQKGIILVAGLIILLVLTILAISVINFSSGSEKLTSNQRDKSIAFQAAESALTEGEAWIKQQTLPPSTASVCTPGPCNVYVLNALTSYQTQTLPWWNSYGRRYSSTLTQVKTQPHFIIEEYSFIPYDLSPQTSSKRAGYYYYRVTAEGTGATDNAKSVVQSIYATQFN